MSKADYYDLILLDVNMPQMNSFELYQEIKKKEKNVKACFVTASEVDYKFVTIIPKACGFHFYNEDSHILVSINIDNDI
jgi:CheY-like chemotaxis protein